jgi:hypothetical protein
MRGKNTEVIGKLKYFGISLEDTGGWRNQKASIKTNGIQALTATDNVQLQLLI